MAAVHQAGVVHGDIKAHNVMREEGGRTVLMDFGAGQTQTGVIPDAPAQLTGTPAYLPPEVLEGQPPTTSTDIYTLGVLLYHLVTGEYPVAGRSPEDLVEAHRRGERRHLRDVRPDLPDDFVRVVEQATASDPARRYASLGAFEDALALVTSAIRAEPEGPLASARPILAAMPRWVMVLTAAAVVVGGATLWLVRPNTAPEATTVVAGQSSPPSPAGSPAAASYEIEAGFYRARGKDAQLLTEDSKVSPGDELFLKFQASKPLNLYVVNEDEKGESFLLFPLPGQRLTNPLPAGQSVTVPDATRWRVTSAGGREHFLVFASPDSLVAFEEVFAALPTPKEARPSVPLQFATTLERLRSVGGLAPTLARQPTGAGLWRMFTTPLTNAREAARGLWVRQITLENPAR
jgi:serine/threonine protein kinase